MTVRVAEGSDFYEQSNSVEKRDDCNILANTNTGGIYSEFGQLDTCNRVGLLLRSAIVGIHQGKREEINMLERSARVCLFHLKCQQGERIKLSLNVTREVCEYLADFVLACVSSTFLCIFN